MTNSNSIRTGATRNTGLKAFVFGVAASLALTLALSTDLNAQSAPAPQIVKLERVVITGKRVASGVAEVQIAQLPRVVIEGRRADTGLQLAAAGCSTSVC